jgi:hypothetical protein
MQVRTGGPARLLGNHELGSYDLTMFVQKIRMM